MTRGSARRLALTLLLVVGAPAASVVGWAAHLRLPPGALDPYALTSLQVLDRRGRVLREVLSREDGRARWVPLAQISPHLVQATLAGEDQRFYRHAGVDWLALGRSLLLNVRAGRLASGASTLTMQLVRLTDEPLPRRSLKRKLRQLVLAQRLERSLSKPEILWQYLNRAPYGNGTFGVEAAARRYFDKPASQVSLAEAALLAALPRSPAGYDPFRQGLPRLVRRQRYLLGVMRAQGRITAEQQRLALAEPLQLDRARRPFSAPHFVERVLRLPEAAEGTQTLRTTLDLELQRFAEVAVARTVDRLRGRGVTNAAVLVVDNLNGEVLAHVGSADFHNVEDGGQNDGTLALRQPGSALKPFTYALALEQRLTPATLLEDLPVHFATDEGDYAPRNYDDTFHGPVRLRVALASSYNVPAVRLAERVGVHRLLERLRAAGFRSLARPARYYGLGLTLGNGEVTLQELVAAYAALARGGRTVGLRLVSASRSPGGAWRTFGPTPSRQLLDRRVAYLVSHILADAHARLPAFGRETPLALPFAVAVKTGTSKDFRDNWTVGYTGRVTVGVWVGNFDGTSMQTVSGITGAGPLFAEVMTAAMRELERPETFPAPDGLRHAQVCPLSGALAGPECAGSIEEHFVAGTEPTSRCTMHQRVRLDRRNGLRAGPACPPAQVEERPMLVFPPAYRAWASARGLPVPPELFSPDCPAPAGAATVRIRFPVEGDRYFLDPDLDRRYQSLPLEATVDGAAREVTWLVDGRPVARAPFPFSARWRLESGRHRVQAQLPDGRKSAPVTVSVD